MYGFAFLFRKIKLYKVLLDLTSKQSYYVFTFSCHPEQIQCLLCPPGECSWDTDHQVSLANSCPHLEAALAHERKVSSAMDWAFLVFLWADESCLTLWHWWTVEPLDSVDTMHRPHIPSLSSIVSPSEAEASSSNFRFSQENQFPVFLGKSDLLLLKMNVMLCFPNSRSVT